MKQIISTSILSFVFLTAIAVNKPIKDNFEILCTFSCEGKSQKDASISIYVDGKLQETRVTKKGKLKLHLPKNHDYLLVFSAKDCFNKRIAISTNVENRQKMPPLFDIDVKFIPEDDPGVLATDIDLLDFPVAYLGFDPERGTFIDKNQYYSAVIRKEIKNSKRKERSQTALSK